MALIGKQPNKFTESVCLLFALKIYQPYSENSSVQLVEFEYVCVYGPCTVREVVVYPVKLFGKLNTHSTPGCFLKTNVL